MLELINTTTLPNAFFRKLLSWSCKETKFPIRKLRSAAFRNGKGGGRAYLYDTAIAVRLAKSSERNGRGYDLDCLVYVTLHELIHLRCVMEKDRTRKSRCESILRYAGSEQKVDGEAAKLLCNFVNNKEEILDKWFSYGKMK